jgi:hypothetical protein
VIEHAYQKLLQPTIVADLAYQQRMHLKLLFLTRIAAASAAYRTVRKFLSDCSNLGKE